MDHPLESRAQEWFAVHLAVHVGAVVVGNGGNPAAALDVANDNNAGDHVVAVSFKTGHLWVSRVKVLGGKGGNPAIRFEVHSARC